MIQVIKPSFKILTELNNMDILKSIEKIGRTCYKSEDKITEESCVSFVSKLISRGHEAMIEHESISVRIVCDRGITHELVRHRLFSFAQESTRYVNYMKKPMQFIKPCFWEEDSYDYKLWYKAMESSAECYNSMMQYNTSPQEARSVLPNSLKTEIVITGNLRQWRNFFKLRCDKSAHPQMREIAIPLCEELKKLVPVIFDDIRTKAKNNKQEIKKETPERKKMIIGISGKLQSGKTILAKFFDTTLGNSKIVSMASPLKEYAKLLGWNGEKDEKGRRCLQLLGTDVGRECIDQDIWVNKWKETIDNLNVDWILVDDVRFNNEAKMIKDLGGIIIQLYRDSSSKNKNTHISEKGIKQKHIDVTIANNKDKSDLYDEGLAALIKTNSDMVSVENVLREKHFSQYGLFIHLDGSIFSFQKAHVETLHTTPIRIKVMFEYRDDMTFIVDDLKTIQIFRESDD